MIAVNRREAIVGACAAISALTMPSPTFAQVQPWPSRSVRLVPFGGAGGAIDTVARILSEGLSVRWKQAIIVEPKPGADGIIAVQAVIADQTGHSLFLGPHSVYAVLHHLNSNISIRPRDVLAPICAVTQDYLGVFVSPRVPARTLRELQEHMRASSTKLNWHCLAGTSLWLHGMEFVRLSGGNSQHVGYKDNAPAAVDLMQNRLDFMFTPLAAMVSHVETGKMVCVGVLNPKRAPLLPNVPTVAEQGFPDLTLAGILGLYARKGTPQAVVELIAADIHGALGVATDRLKSASQIPDYQDSSKFTAFLDDFERKIGSLARLHRQG